MKVYYINTRAWYPFWIKTTAPFENIPSKHVEDIIKQLGLQWIEFEYSNNCGLDLSQFPNEISFNIKLTNIPIYIKIVDNNTNYYFCKYNRVNTKTIDKEGNFIYQQNYILDSYMTKYYWFLKILIDNNPTVFFKHWYKEWWTINQDGSWSIDFVARKDLSQFENNQNYEMVRNEVYALDEQTLWNNNFKDTTIPTNINIKPYGNNTKTVLQYSGNVLYDLLKRATKNGRYWYIIAKSSALQEIATSKITQLNSDEDILIIPLFVDNIITNLGISNTIKGLLNPFITEDNDGFYLLNALGSDNFIGCFQADLPFTYLLGLYLNNKIEMFYTRNYTKAKSENIYSDIVFFKTSINNFFNIKLIDFNDYKQGFYGKIYNAIANLEKRTPETEIGLLAPQYYKEQYKIGNTIFEYDFSKFKYDWKNSQLYNLSLQVYLNFNDNLYIGFNWAELTNKQLVTYDNNFLSYSSIGIPIGLLGSSSANYYANNINSGLVSSLNRKDERSKNAADASLNTVIDTVNYIGKTAGGSVTKWLNPGTYVAAGAYAIGLAAKIAKTWTDFAFNEQIANRDYYNNINNISSSPAPTLTNPYIYGLNNNEGKLFNIYKVELHEWDKQKVFANLLNYGRIACAYGNFNQYKACKYMNILDIDSYKNYEVLLKLLKENTTTVFNTLNDYDEFIVWLNSPKHIYETNQLVNVLDWKAQDYIDNYYLAAFPDKPQEKINIHEIIKNYPNSENKIGYHKDYLIQWLKDNNTIEEQYSDIWDYLNITIDKNNEYQIITKDNSKYYDTIIGYAYFYDTIYDNTKQGFSIYYGKISDLDTLHGLSIDNLEEGSSLVQGTFTFLEKSNSDRIPDNFLYGCEKFNSPITIPIWVGMIGKNFMYNCKSFYQDLNIPDTVMWIRDSFMYNCYQCINIINFNNLTSDNFLINGTDNLSFAVDNHGMPTYYVGFQLKGNHIQDIVKTWFPDRDTLPYRKIKIVNE